MMEVAPVPIKPLKVQGTSGLLVMNSNAAFQCDLRLLLSRIVSTPVLDGF